MNTNTIILGDCRDVMRGMPDESVDCIITSPPYDNMRDYNKSSEWNFGVFTQVADEIIRVLKQGRVCVWIVNDQVIKGSKSLTSFRQAIYFKKNGLRVHDVMIWNKGCFSHMELNRYAQTAEYMFVFSKGAPAVVNKIKDRKNISYGARMHGGQRQADGTVIKRKDKTPIAEYGERFNVWDIPPCNSIAERCGHVAPFPIKLAADHIRTWTNENDIVLDPFVGGGTTAVAAIQLNRRFIGIEIDPEYHAMATRRITPELNTIFNHKKSG
jgi:site-specific DNA-methyltransferase (adenine-specific)